MKKAAAVILLICLTGVFAVVKTAGGADLDARQEESYVGGDLRGNHAARLFAPYEIDGIEDGFEIRQCVYHGDQLVLAATRKSQEETVCLFYILDKEKEAIEKLTEITVAELYNIDGHEDGRLIAFAKTDKDSAGSILELSSAGVLSGIELKGFPRAAALKPVQAWKIENNYLLVCSEGLFVFDPENGDIKCVFENKKRIYSVFRNRDGTLLFYTCSCEPFSTQAETCLYQLNEEFVPELVVKKDALATFWPGTSGFCLMSSEDREDQLYKLNLETREESSFAYTGNIPMTGDYFYVSEDRLLFWNYDLPLGLARPAEPGEYQIINIAGWIPDGLSASYYIEYYTARAGLLPKVIEFAVSNGKEYIPCYTLYEGKSGLKELEMALADGFIPDILDTTWLLPGTGSEYLMDLRPLLSDSILESGLVLDREESDASREFTPALILSAAYFDGPLWENLFSENSDPASMSRDKFLRLAAPLIYTMLMNDGGAEEVAEIIAYASALPEKTGDTEMSSHVVLPLQEQSLFLCGPMSLEEILNKARQASGDKAAAVDAGGTVPEEIYVGVLPVFKMGIASDIPEEKLASCVDFFEFCLTQRECAFAYDRIGISLYREAESPEQQEDGLKDLIRQSLADQCYELYLDPVFPCELAQVVEACAAGNMTPELGAKQLREYVAMMLPLQDA